MTLRWLLAAAHLLVLGIGLGAVWARARALSTRDLDLGAIRRALVADAWWGIAALVWVSTGLVRLLAGTEKPTAYYLHSHAFWGKMALFVAILVLEVRPIVTFGRWRALARRGELPVTTPASSLARISYIQAVLVILMVLAATAMARGLGSGQ
jgi:putative membrane protein